MMIDTKYKNNNSIKFKDETECQLESKSQNYSNLISQFNRENCEKKILLSSTKLTSITDRNLNEIEYENADRQEKEAKVIDNADTVISKDENKNVNLMDNDEEANCSDENLNDKNKVSIQDKTRTSSQPNTQTKPTQKISSIPNSNSFSQQPSTSQQNNQQISQQTNKQFTSQQSTNSNEGHSVHFIANRNENKSAISIGHFSIYLDRLDYEYRPSDTLTGKLHIFLESGELSLRRIVIYLKGISSVKFTEREYQSTSQSERHFEDVEYWSDNYLLEMKTRPKLSSNLRILEPGEYHLPFRFTFPSTGLPSSFESTFGYIRYWIYAEIRSRDKNREAKENHIDEDSNIATSELPVEVFSECTIPIEELRRPINAEQLKVMGCCTCFCLFRNPDFIQVRANLMHQGQRKGSSVQVNLFIVNRSNKQITPHVILKSRSEFRAINKTKVNELEIIGVSGNVVKSGETIMQTILMPLSYDLPILYDSPNIIINYRIKIAIEIPNSFDINFHLPIFLTNQKFPIRPVISN